LLDDNGSPFAKANNYLASDRTPMIVRWARDSDGAAEN